MTATENVSRIASLSFQTDTCGRCSGSGAYPSAYWNGVCLGCSGTGRRMARAGIAARKAYDAYLEQHHSRLMIDVAPGESFRKQGRWVRVHAVDTELRRGGTCTIGSGDNAVSYSTLNIVVTTRKADGTEVRSHVQPYDTVIVRPTGEAAQAAFRSVAKRKGAIFTYAE